jgi:response regulator RpfG family c-di-GMP phosphodiesterase
MFASQSGKTAQSSVTHPAPPIARRLLTRRPHSNSSLEPHLKPLHVLIVEDSQDDAVLLVWELRRGGYDPIYARVDTSASMQAALEQQEWEVVIADYNLPHFNALDALHLLKEKGLDLPFIIVSGYIGEDMAVAAMKAGAHDYFRKDNLVRLVPAIERELREAEGRRARRRAEEETRRAGGRAEALARVAARLNDQLELEVVFNAVCEETARALLAPAVSLDLYDPRRNAFRYAASFGLPPEYGKRAKPVPLTLYEEYARQMGQIINLPDVQSVPDWPNAGLYAELNIRTILGTSLARGGQLVGALTLFTIDHARHFTEDDQALLRGLADQAAQAITNAHLFAESRRRTEHLQALRTIDMAITASTDLRITLSIVLDEVIKQLKVDAAAVLLLSPHTQNLEYAAGRGFRTTDYPHMRLRLGESYAGRAALERRTVNVDQLAEAPGLLTRIPFLGDEGFVAYYGAPLIAKGQVKGVLEIFHRAPLSPDPEWKEFLEALAGQTAIAIDSASLFTDLQRSNLELMLAYDTTLEGWSRALDLRDKETEGHTQRVTEGTLKLARMMGLSEQELIHIRRGALLHDIGKMGIPDNILLKPGPLTEEEWEIMRQHPVYAYEMLLPIGYLRLALDISYCHHEKWDGTGYPRGLKGEQIPLSARIFAVVDVWDALRSNRPYRAAWPKEKVREHIQSLSGTHFDPKVVEAFLTIADW